MNTSDLRKVCGHDSYSVDGCIICEAAELIDYCLKGNNIEQQLQQAHRDATEEVAKAHKRGWKQGKKEAFEIARTTQIGYIQTTIAAMEYKERTNG